MVSMKFGKLLDFIRAMKKANRRQVIGAWYSVNPKTNEVCGCAMGQALLNLNLVTEDQVRASAKTRGTKRPAKIYDPITRKTVTEEVLTTLIPIDATGAHNFLRNEVPDAVKTEIMILNDHKNIPVGDIAAKMYERFAQ